MPVLFADAIERSLRDVQPYRIEGEPVAVRLSLRHRLSLRVWDIRVRLAAVLDPYRVSLDD